VTGCAGTLGSGRGSISGAPEAPSPRRINISRDISTADSEYPPSRFEDLKEAAIRSSTTFINPREAPRYKDETEGILPFMAGPRVTPVSEYPTAPPPANLAASGRARKVERSASLKGGLFGFGNKSAPSITVAKVMISHPILQDNDAQNPLNKIATIELEEAARAERERRAKIQADPPVPKRPITQMSMSPEEVMKRGVSVKRKEIGSMASQQNEMPTTLQPESTALTSAAQLSPGVEELRRRSPRQPYQEQAMPISCPITPLENIEVAEIAQTAQVMENAQMPTQAQAQVPRQEVTAPKPVARPEIRPSRQAPPSPKKAPSPEPPATALQRRPTIGLPTNPRARALKAAQDASAQQQQSQTVMFVNNIVYNDPTAVQNIIKGASNLNSKNNAGARESEASVVNRPRPVPRRADSVAQPSPSPKHKRNKSGGSMSRKSVMTSAPGSPTQLPPLPPPPVSLGISIRPQPNDTKSMTVDEKMTLFFPSPPSGGNAAKRKSAVPQLPPIPVSYLDTGSSPTESRRSNRTTKTSFKTDSILDVDEIPRKKPEPTSRFSPLTELNLGDDVGESWIPGISTDNRSTGSSRGQVTGPAAKRASSPIIPQGIPNRESGWTDNSDSRTEDDATTNWGTVHSPEIAVGVQVMQKGVQASAIRTAERRPPAPARQHAPPVPQRQDNITFMLDQLDFERHESWHIEHDQPKPEPKRSTPSPSQWHRRVGDECPTFSAREKTRSRKAPAPTPLMLNGRPSKNTIVIQAEPSPLESPEHALREIQAQLKKLDQTDRDSMNSTSRRLALLENLEKEMGQQEDHWQEMKHDLGRDSMASVQTTSPNRNSRIEPARSSIALERRASRRAKMRNSGAPKGADNAALSPDSQRTTNVWKKRLTEAQSEYLEVAANLLQPRNVNGFMSLSKAQLGSPTPPDSEDSDQDLPQLASRLKAIVQPLQGPASVKSLWKPAPRRAPVRRHLLWAPIQRAHASPEPELPGLSVRPAPRKESAPLEIRSVHLWRKPYVDDGEWNGGLWRPVWASAAPRANANRQSTQGIPQSQSQKAPRPLTQRPPRRNKRMTLLPDILESPEPLPDKRGTLGIFQFPWGERSDMASIQSSRPSMFMAMPGTMASGGPSLNAAQEQRARQLESAEYSSSFFDDYDDDEENSDEAEGEESDDGFDETTLWEIASLLKTDNVPSKNSLLPPPAKPRPAVEEYLDDIPSDDDTSRGQSIVIGLGEPRDVLFEQPRQLNMKAESQQPPKPKGKSQAIVTDDKSFWTLEEELQSKDSPPAAAPVPRPRPAVIGLPANPKSSKIPRAQPAAAPAPFKPSHIVSQVSIGLWNPPKTSSEPASSSLFVPNTTRTQFRTTSAEPAAKAITRKPRPAEALPLERLSSTGLWNARTHKKTAKNWGIRIPDASSEDWENALKDALAAGYKRGTATAVEWSLALAEAVQSSSNPRLDVTTRHPVFAASSLITKSEWFHPAATGYTYDAAMVHPVFFGSLAITCPAEAVHPAFGAYAQKKMRRQRSKVSTRDRPASRGKALGRSDSANSINSKRKDKEEIRAQIRALEQGVSAPELPILDPIMAQIQALEQERLFVQQAAQEEYRRRTSVSYGMYTQQPMTEEPVLMSPEEVVAQQQRRMSQAQMRESMIWGAQPVKLVNAKLVDSKPAAMKGLWTAPAKAAVSQGQGLWTPGPAVALTAVVGMEDTEAHLRRARGRKAMQKMARRAEILAQIAAIEADIDPLAEFKSQQLWRVTRMRRSKKRDWLHERKPSRVALRY